MNRNDLKEKIPHGNSLFPMDIHFTVTEPEWKKKLYCHWHEEFEFLFVTKGGADFHVDTRSYRVLAGEALYINSNLLHSADSIGNMPCNYFAIVVNLSLLISNTNDIIQQKYIEPVLNSEILFPEHINGRTEWGKRVISLLIGIKDIFNCKENGYELLVKTKLFEIWHLMTLHSDNANQAAVKSNDYKAAKIKKILEYIHSNYSQEITLTDLSALSHMSEGEFCRFFKRMVKMSAIHYINYYRINKSVCLLKETDKKVSEIACLVGFNNTSYFNKTFRKYMNSSPSEYKRKSDF